MSETMWAEADGYRMRQFIIKQDRRFQAAMRDELTLPSIEQEEAASMALGCRQIIAETCAKHKVSERDVMSPLRDKMTCLCRDEIFYRLRQETTKSWPSIGARLNRDHATALVGANRHAKRLEAFAK